MRRKSPRLLLPLLAAVVLVAGACSGQTQPTEYGEDYKDNFMYGCHSQVEVPEEDVEDTTPGPEAPKDYCECVYDGLVEKVNFDDAKAFEEQQAEDSAGEIEVPKNIQAVFDSCDDEG